MGGFLQKFRFSTRYKLMKNIFHSAALLIIVFQAFPLQAATVDLNRQTIYVRKGFNENWVQGIPTPGDTAWLAVPGVTTPARKVVLKELTLEGMPARPMFSLKKYAPENFTFLTEFMLGEKDPSMDGIQGFFFANIGENWAVYLNGRLLRSEVHLDGKGNITHYRHYRVVLVPIDPRILRKGSNILAVRIIGDPTNIDSGFHRSTPFIMDTMQRLEALRSEQTSMILIFLYL
jgi:hypothetical protein